MNIDISSGISVKILVTTFTPEFIHTAINEAPINDHTYFDAAPTHFRKKVSSFFTFDAVYVQ